MTRWRPLYHYSARQNWLSDPNGLVWHDGVWHMYYQYNPHGDTWGHMCWGHAVSDDLVRWTEQPVAIWESDRHMIFSGSAVTDPDGRILAAYTGATRDEPPIQAQFLVRSDDGGQSFDLAGEAAIDENAPDFRDPKLFWHQPSQQWIMVAVRADRNCAVVYSSSDLTDWQLLSQIGPFDLPGQVWECPDLMQIPVDGGGSRWLFKVDILHVTPSHPGSGAIAMSGDFDGGSFLPDTDLHGKPIWQWVDHGRDFYAAVGWNGGPPGDDGRYWIGWMGNHRYQNDLPETGWRGAMSLARRLSFREQDGVYRLVQQPVAPACADFVPCIGEALALAAGDAVQLRTGLPRAFACRVHFASGAGTMIIGAGQGKIRIAFDASARTITCDRALAGSMQDDADFCRPMSAPWLDPSAPVTLWVDDHSLEIFADSGTTAMTVQSFLTPGPIDLMLDSSASASHWQDISIAPVLGEWTAGD